METSIKVVKYVTREECHLIDKFNEKYGINNNHKLYNGIIYITYGGGPEGGYVKKGNKIYSVDRNWLKPWTYEITRYSNIKNPDKYGYITLN